MTFRDEKLNNYVNSIFTEASAMSREVDRLRAQGYSDEDIAAKGEAYANELARKNGNINVNQVISDNNAKVNQANAAATDATNAAYDVSENDPGYDAAYEDAVAAQMNATKVSSDAASTIADAKQQAQQKAAAKKAAAEEADNAEVAAAEAARNEKLTQLKAANADKYRQELAQQKAEYEKALADLEDYKKQVKELKAKVENGEGSQDELANAEEAVDKQEEVVAQEQQDVAEAEKEAETAAAETPTAEGTPTAEPAASVDPATGAPVEAATNAGAGTPEKTPEQVAQETAAANAQATNDAMTVKPGDDPSTQAAKESFQQEWASLKAQVNTLQTTTKQIMSSPAASAYMKARPDLTQKFQKFGGALASVGAILGIAGTIAMFIPGGQAIGALLKAGGMVAGGIGGATASGASAVNQFKNGNVLGGIGSLAAGAAAAGMAVGGAGNLGNSINAMRTVNTTGANVVTPAVPETTTPTTTPETPASVPGTNPAQITTREPTIANTNAAVAAAKPGDVLQRNDGTRIEINQGDINWAKNHMSQPTVDTTNTIGNNVVQPVVQQNNGPLFDYNSFKQNQTPQLKVPSPIIQPDFLKNGGAAANTPVVPAPQTQTGLSNFDAYKQQQMQAANYSKALQMSQNSGGKIPVGQALQMIDGANNGHTHSSMPRIGAKIPLGAK